jgi:hypothetical protein
LIAVHLDALLALSLIVGPGGVLFGTTLSGGSNYGGIAYELFPPATSGGTWTEQILISFTGGNVGYQAWGSLVLNSKGAFYGVTTAANVYKLTPPAVSGGPWTETVLSRSMAPMDPRLLRASCSSRVLFMGPPAPVDPTTASALYTKLPSNPVMLHNRAVHPTARFKRHSCRNHLNRTNGSHPVETQMAESKREKQVRLCRHPFCYRVRARGP